MSWRFSLPMPSGIVCQARLGPFEALSPGGRRSTARFICIAARIIRATGHRLGSLATYGNTRLKRTAKPMSNSGFKLRRG